jgi:hypothetical protein
MKNSILVLCLMISYSLSYGQQDSIAMHYASTILASELSEHLHIIAADDYEGRESGYAGQKKCEQYMVDFYRKLGLPPVEGSYTQEFELYLNDPTRVYVSSQGREYQFLKDFYYYPATNDGKIEAPLYYGGYGITNWNFKDIDLSEVKGKIVMIRDGEPFKNGVFVCSGTKEPSDWSTDGEKKWKQLEENGALAVIIVYKDYDARAKRVANYFTHKGMSLVKQAESSTADMPVMHVSEAMGKTMVGEKLWKKANKALARGKSVSLKDASANIQFSRKEKILISSNVMGYIEGSDKKEELVIITAHYDHIGVDEKEVYNGADDDGSGTVATMEIAEAFAKAKAEGHGPRRSVMILNVSAEEKGLLGSQYYSENPIFPLENTVANLNIDMIGRVDEQHKDNDNYVYIIGADRISQDLHDIGEKMNRTYSNLELDYTFNAEDDPNRFYYRSDHYNFAKNGVPSVFYFSGVHEDYHKPGDTVDKIMFPKLEKISRLIFYTAWELANREERIRSNETN